MSFIKDLKETQNGGIYNESYTENGALGFATTGQYLLDMFFATSSLRKASEKEIIDTWVKAYSDNPTLALKLLFYARDVRQGLGERRLFRVIIKYIANNQPSVVEKLIQFIPEYGRWDDLFCLLNTPLIRKILELVEKQLNEDVANHYAEKPVSLLAKWLPTKDTRKQEKKLWYTTLKNIIVKNHSEIKRLKRYLDIVEIKMSNREWKSINYSTVPSKANLRYNKAFFKNDEQRRKEFLESLVKGETKINAGTLFSHEIVKKYNLNYYGGDIDTTLEELWKALPDTVNGNANTLVIRDGSWSMNGEPLDIATALSIYFSERQNGEFKDKFITFSSKPKLVDLSNLKNLHDKLIRCYSENDCSNTDIEKTFKLVLDTAIQHNLTQEQIPNLLIISDMEFDSATNSRNNEKLFETIANQYAEYGYKLPRLAFWNVSSRTNTIPIIKNKLGVVLVSGYSTNVIKMVVNDCLDPYENLVSILNGDRYKVIF